jgi:hypothetical protein
LDVSQQPGHSENAVRVRARTHLGDITVRRAHIEDSGQGAA